MEKTIQTNEKMKFSSESRSSLMVTTSYLSQNASKALLKTKTLMMSFVLLFLVTTALTAQTTSDQALVLQKCVDLTQLQQFYPKNTDNSFQPLVIMQHAISFPTNISVAHSGDSLLFKSKSEVSSDSAYFLFWKFDILGSNAKVDFIYNYDLLTTVPKVQKVTLELLKTGSVWNVTSSSILGGTL